MHNDNTPRAPASIDALLRDLCAELERESRRGTSDVTRNALTGMLFEIFDAMRYRFDELAAEYGRALADKEIAIVVSGGRQAIALAVEVRRQDEAARARALGERITPHVAPRGAFERPRAQPPPLPPRVPGRAGRTSPGMPSVPPPPPRQLAPTVPVDVHDRITSPAPAPSPKPYRGQPHKPGERASEAPFMDDEPTPGGMQAEPPKPPGRRRS